MTPTITNSLAHLATTLWPRPIAPLRTTLGLAPPTASAPTPPRFNPLHAFTASRSTPPNGVSPPATEQPEEDIDPADRYVRANEVPGVRENRHMMDICVGCLPADIALWKRMYKELPKLDALAGPLQPQAPMHSFGFAGQLTGQKVPWCLPGSITMTHDGTEKQNVTRLAHEYGHQIMEGRYPAKRYKSPPEAAASPSSPRAMDLQGFYRGLHELVADVTAVLYVGDLAATGDADPQRSPYRYFDRPLAPAPDRDETDCHAMYGPTRAALGPLIAHRMANAANPRREAQGILEEVVTQVGRELDYLEPKLGKGRDPKSRWALMLGLTVAASNDRLIERIEAALASRATDAAQVA